MKVLPKILIFFSFLLSTFYLLPSAAPALAQINTAIPVSNTNPDVPPRNPVATGNVVGTFPSKADYVPNNLHNWTQTVMIEVMSSLTCQLAGVDPINPKQSCLGADQITGKIGFLPKAASPAGASAQAGGAIGFMGNMISVLYTPPLHTADYFQNLAQNFGITKKAYAANDGGTGFQSLTPLIGIWSAFRNIVYLLLVIVFVVIGLAIMLRVKIDPRTVMTIQNQIPKIIMGILAVTFSFAIAGFLIDMMWVFIYLIYGIFSGIPGVNVADLNPAVMQGQSAMGAAGRISTTGIFGITSNVAGSIKDTVGSLFHIEQCTLCFGSVFNPFKIFADIINPIDTGVTNWLIDLISYAAGIIMFFNVSHIPTGSTPILSDVLGFFKTGLGAPVAGWAVFTGTESLLRIGLPYLIAYLIIFIALLTALFRLWFTLLMAYVQILLAVVLAPFWIIGGIVPGSPISLSGWLKGISANLLAFPVTIAMFMLGKVFMDIFGKAPSGGQNFVPPLIGNPGDPSLIGSLIGLGILLMTPNVVNMLKTALKAPKMDLGIGKSIAPGLAVPGRTVSGVGGLAFGSAIEKGFLDKEVTVDGVKTIQKSALGRALRLFRGGGR